MARGPGSNLPGAPTDDYWNSRMTPAALLGISPASGSKAAGAALPPTSHVGGDLAMVPWSPDSPMFWLIAITGLTVFGITGASFRVRVGKGRAGANIGAA